MKPGIALAGGTPVAAAVTCARLADELGYDSIWITESTAHEAFSFLGAVATATKNIRVATGIINVFVRPPALTAMGIATLDEISHGRAILGLGASNRDRVESAFDLPYSNPLTKMREYVEAVRRILAGEKVKLVGESLRVDFQLGFTPSRSRIPIYVAALRDRMSGLAAEVGDGVLLYFRHVAALRDAVRTLSGKGRAGTVASFLNLAMDRDGEAARSVAGRVVAQFARLTPYRRLMAQEGFGHEARMVEQALAEGRAQDVLQAVGESMPKALAIAGTPEECQSMIEQYRGTGIALPIFYLHPVGPDVHSSLEYMVRNLINSF